MAIQADAQRRDNEAIATAVAGSVRATQTALTAQAAVETQQRAADRTAQDAALVIGLIGLTLGVVIALWLLLGVARTTRRRAASEPETVIIDLEHAIRMAAYRELWKQQRAMLDPLRALPAGQVIECD